MGVLLLGGPPAVGHNTVGELVCRRRERQYRVCIRAACALARSFDADAIDVVIVDVAPPSVIALYRAQLADVRALWVVLLSAPADVLIARNCARDPKGVAADATQRDFWVARIAQLHAELLSGGHAYDQLVDTEELGPDGAANALAALLG